METTTFTTTTPNKRISRTVQWARAHKWMIEVLDPELQNTRTDKKSYGH